MEVVGLDADKAVNFEFQPLPLLPKRKERFVEHCVDEDLSHMTRGSSDEVDTDWKHTFNRAYMCSYDGKWDSTDDFMFVIKRCTNQESIKKKFLKTSNISQVQISSIHYIIMSTNDCTAENNPEQKVNRMLLICRDRHGDEIHTLHEDVHDFPELLIEYSKAQIESDLQVQSTVQSQVQSTVQSQVQSTVGEEKVQCEFNNGAGACKCDGCLAEFRNIDTLYDYAHGCFDEN